MNFRMVQEQQMKLTMTPKLQQAIAILQYSTLDLYEYIREQTEHNPLLEFNEPEILKADTGAQDRSMSFEQDLYVPFHSQTAATAEHQDPLDFYVHEDHSLVAYVLEQISYLNIHPSLKQLLQFLAGNLDEKGYLTIDNSEGLHILGCTREQWEEALGILQSLEPHGVGARDLRESLLIQWKYRGEDDQLVERILEDHLQDVAHYRYSRMASQLQVTETEVGRAVEKIQQLQPYPATGFETSSPQVVIPDVIVQEVEAGRYVVQVNDTVLPHIQFNDHYQALSKDCKETAKFVQEKMQQYQWLMRSIEQRKHTILKVTETIMEKQKSFLKKGFSSLRPLSLREVAEELDIHESTVSRATKHKYVQTPLGVFELKRFFAHKVSTSHDNQFTDAYVKQRMKEMIENEDPARPFSDTKIVHQLKAEGIHLARRTVAKYRDQLGILSSSKRKKRV